MSLAFIPWLIFSFLTVFCSSPIYLAVKSRFELMRFLALSNAFSRVLPFSLYPTTTLLLPPIKLVLDMKEAMVKNNGVGLAANQIGKDLAIFVIDVNVAKTNNVPEAYFNPEITEYSRESDEIEEGCLSIPEYFIPIKRSKKVMLKFMDEEGKKRKIKARGFLARIYQHETDHLNGLVIKDRK